MKLNAIGFLVIIWSTTIFVVGQEFLKNLAPAGNSITSQMKQLIMMVSRLTDY